MKKLILSSILCFALILPSAAQEAAADPTVNKRGIALLPQAGDFAIGIDATPFLQYLGNFFNQAGTNQAPFVNGVDNKIYVKYFLEDDQAIRAKLHLNFTQDKYKQTVRDDSKLLDPTNDMASVVDVQKINTQGIGLDLGYEFRRGKGRVQGFYGGEVSLGYDRKTHKYDYANPITVSNQQPSFYSFESAAKGYRVLEKKSGAEFSAGLGGFVGIEYFFAPQISIGGELGLGFTYFIKGQNKFKTEGFLNNGVIEYQYRERNAIENAFKTGITTVAKEAEIFLMFHF